MYSQNTQSQTLSTAAIQTSSPQSQYDTTSTNMLFKQNKTTTLITLNISNDTFMSIVRPINLLNHIWTGKKLKAFADDKKKCYSKIEICFVKDRKYCGKRRKCWITAFSPFPTIQSEVYLLRAVKAGIVRYRVEDVYFAKKHLFKLQYKSKIRLHALCSLILIYTVCKSSFSHVQESRCQSMQEG